jgi:probable rRNA maturation factor
VRRPAWSGRAASGTVIRIDNLELEIQGDDSAGVRAAARAALAAAGVRDGHLAIDFVDEAEIRALNRDHRGRDTPTDVLSFPVDGAAPDPAGPRELGDVVICREHTSDVDEAVVHGVLHLCGYDHETDSGEMLDLQDRILEELRG